MEKTFSCAISVCDLTCPITGQLFKDPVLADDGFIYEREGITTHFKYKTTSPFTGKEMKRILISALFIKNIVNKYLESNPDGVITIHFKHQIYNNMRNY